MSVDISHQLSMREFFSPRMIWDLNSNNTSRKTRNMQISIVNFELGLKNSLNIDEAVRTLVTFVFTRRNKNILRQY